MSVLILEEKRFPSAIGKTADQVKHHKPIHQALMKLSEVYKDIDVFDFHYAIDTPIQQDDFSTVSKKAFDKAFDDDHVFNLLTKHKVVILMGGRLCERVLNKKLKSVLNKIQKIGDTIIIPTYSCFYLHKNKKSCVEVISKAYRHFIGEALDRNLPDFKIIKTLGEVKEVIDYCNQQGIFSFDYETANYVDGKSHLEYHNKDTVATVLSLCFQPGFSYVIPIEHKDFDWGDGFSALILLLKVLFENPDTIKIAHNAKYDLHWHVRYGINIRGRLCDTLLMHHVIDEHGKHGLKELIKEYFPFWVGYEDGVDFIGPLEQLSKYAGIDTDITLRLFYIFENYLLQTGHEKMYRLMRNLLIPSVLTLQRTEYDGCKIDRKLILKTIEEAEIRLEKKIVKLKNFKEVKTYIAATNKKKVAKKIEELEAKILKRSEKFNTETDKYINDWKADLRNYKTGGVELYKEINYGSWQQLADFLYTKDGLNLTLRDFDGNITTSTNKDMLIQSDHPFINLLLAYRSITKMISTYYKGILDRLDVNDYLHGSFLLHGTVTGRLSSRNPNLQNMPTRASLDDEDAVWCLKQVKKFFIPRAPNRILLQADYGQAELRVIANFSGDKTMIAAYNNGEDLHAKTGAVIRGLSEAEFKKLPKDEFKKYRTYAKPANFGWVYKSSIDGYRQFAKNNYGVEVSEKEAQLHKDAIFKTYKSISLWHKKCETKAKRQGYLETLLGRRRRFLNINNTSNKGLINKDIRDAINNPVQGTAGEITIFCMTLLRHRLPDDCLIWSNVHDAIYFDLPIELLSYCLPIINEACENTPLDKYFNIKYSEFPVPMKMDYEFSKDNWRGMEEVAYADALLIT